MQYNIQPYKRSGDACGFRTTLWYKEQVIDPFVWPLALAPIYNMDKKPNSVCLDVGCGNGRLEPIIAPMFGKVWALDPVVRPNPKFDAKNVKWITADFTSWPIRKFDFILLMGSLNIMIQNYGFQPIMKRTKRMLAADGKIIALLAMDNHHQVNWFELPRMNFMSTEMHVTADRSSIVLIARRESEVIVL